MKSVPVIKLGIALIIAFLFVFANKSIVHSKIEGEALELVSKQEIGAVRGTLRMHIVKEVHSVQNRDVHRLAAHSNYAADTGGLAAKYFVTPMMPYFNKVSNICNLYTKLRSPFSRMEKVNTLVLLESSILFFKGIRSNVDVVPPEAKGRSPGSVEPRVVTVKENTHRLLFQKTNRLC